MLELLRKRVDQDEQGFTLIELLVVVIIIGILAAIAIPTFLSQRERGWQAELMSTVRNVALEVEAAATAANGSYVGIVQGDVTGFANTIQGANTDPVEVTLNSATVTTFCITGRHTNLADNGAFVVYNSAAGGIQPFGTGACAGGGGSS